MSGSPSGPHRWPGARLRPIARAARVQVNADELLYLYEVDQTPQPRAPVPTHPSRPPGARHPPQDPRRPAAPGDLRRPAVTGRPTRCGTKGSASAAGRSTACPPPEVACIGKGKARTPYDFGCRVSVATPVTKPKGGQFVLHAKALHGNPYDGPTLGSVVAEMEELTGVDVCRVHVDKGCAAASEAPRS